MNSTVKAGIILACIFSFFPFSETKAQMVLPSEAQSRVWLYGEVHGSKITGSMSDLIDVTDSASNDKVIYGIGVRLAYFPARQICIGPVLELSWWNGGTQLRGTSGAISGRLFLNDPLNTTPYFGIQTGKLWINTKDTFGSAIEDQGSYWFYRFELGFSFRSKSKSASHLELYYKVVPINMEIPPFVSRITGENPKLTYIGVEFGVGIPL